MFRIHLYMCSFLVSFILCSSSTNTTQSPSVNVTLSTSITPAILPSPSTTVVILAPISNQTSFQAGQTVTVTPGSSETAIQSNASASVNVPNVSTTDIAPSPSDFSSSTSTSTSVAPGQQTTKKFQARMTVKETYISDYNDSSSADFKRFAANFSQTVGAFLGKRLTGFDRVEVTRLQDGSVVVSFDIVVQNSSNASVEVIADALKAGNGRELGYTILGEVSVNATDQPSTSSTPSPATSVTATPVPPTSSTKATEIWDKAIDLATPLGTFIIVVVAVALILILLIVLICVCCKYARLKKKTRFPEHMAINDSEWIRSSDDLLMWERNLRASEVKTTNGVSSRPVNDKRT